MFGRKSTRRGELEERLQLVDGGGDELVHTPSVAADLSTGLSRAEAARGQRLREQLRSLDTEIANAKAQLIRQLLLRGPSGRQFECDKDCVVGGCGETFAEEDGVLCSCTECQLFLCHKCFGHVLVTNECQVGGRYDKSIDTASGSGLMSAPGSLPCPLYPSQCSCGHIPLAAIQRALLHESNRGADGSFEDIESPGLSPHKIFLIARRRQAETKLTGDVADGLLRLRESTLVRTVTEARTTTSGALGRSVSAMRAFRSSTTFQSGARAALADKCDEFEQLRDELQRMTNGAETAIPPNLHRVCAQCDSEVTCFEGGQCGADQTSHFLCNVCFGGYLMHACSRGGVFEQALKNDDGMVVSPVGKLPCPFFRGHDKPLISPTKNFILDCRCGIIESSTIERVLMDPRNKSRAYWRQRGANAAIDAQAAAQGVLASDRATSGPWSVGIEFLAREWTPSAVHETARLRIGVDADRAEQQRRDALGAGAGGGADALAELGNKVIAALTKGASIRCPNCGVHAVKDDACIHMDSCPCRSSWCFLCGRLTGSNQEGRCPRGGGGCDQETYYLEQMDGWGHFALPGENAAFGAQQEFLRRRQAFYVRGVMEQADSQLWAQLRERSPGLLSDCPTPGRKIEWDDLALAEFPLFGGNQGSQNINDWLLQDNAPVDEAAAARFEAHFRHAAEAERQQQLLEQRRQRSRVVLSVALVLVAAGMVCLLALFPTSNPRTDSDPHVPQNTTVATGGPSPEPQEECTTAMVTAVSFVMEVPCGCGVLCDLLFWVPVIETLSMLGIATLAVCGLAISGDGDWPGIAFAVAVWAAITCWPLLTGPLAHWVASLVFGPICAGAGATISFFVPIFAGLDMEDRIGEDKTMGVAGCLCLLSYAAYLGITIHARSLVGGTVVADQEEHFEISEFACTTACWMLRYYVWAMTGLGSIGVVLVVHAEGWRGGEKFVLSLVGLAVLCVVGLWPEAVSMLSVSTLATAGAWWIYPSLFVSISCVGLLVGRTLAKVSNSLCDDPFGALQDSRMYSLIAGLPGALGCAFLYMYRAGIPEYEGASSPWASMVHAMITVCLVLTLVLAIADDDDELSSIAVSIGLMSVWLCGENADGLQEIWILVVLCLFFSLFFGGLAWVIFALIADSDGAERCSGRCTNLAACLVVLALNAAMIVVFSASGQTMPHAFQVSSANEWQVGNFSSVNGIYHLRIDLRDGKTEQSVHTRVLFVVDPPVAWS